MDNADKGCLFCKIIAGNIPSLKVYEDETLVAFLPLAHINPGHVLLMPKTHYDNYADIPSELASHLTHVSQLLGKNIMDKFSPKKVGYSIVGLEINHSHIHIIPLYKMHEITSSVYAGVENGEIVFSTENLPVASEEERVRIQRLLNE